MFRSEPDKGFPLLVETTIPGTDDWWLVRLCNQLGSGLPRLANLRKYRDGDALLPDNQWDTGARQSYIRFCKRARLHVAETLRDARTDRQSVIGFRTAATNDEDGDTEAWRRWKRNRMAVQARTLFDDTADYGASYITTLPNEDRAQWLISNEWKSITEQNTIRPWLADAGILVGHDPVAGEERVILFRPGYYRIAIRRTAVPTLPDNGSPWSVLADWTWATPPIVTPYAQDALITRNRTRDGYGIYEKHLDTIDRINEITLNALTLIVMQSFRQRGVKGNLPEYYPEGHPQAGEKIDYDAMFEAGPAALWMLPVGADIWESQSTDVTPIYTARQKELQVLSSLTRTPQDIFNGDSQNQSAMGAEISREPLIHAVRRMNDEAEVAISQALSLDFQISGDVDRAEVTDIEVMFGKINPATLAEKGEAVAKMANAVPSRYIDSEVLEMTPAQRRQAEADRSADAFRLAMSAAANTSTGVGVGSAAA